MVNNMLSKNILNMLSKMYIVRCIVVPAQFDGGAA